MSIVSPELVSPELVSPELVSPELVSPELPELRVPGIARCPRNCRNCCVPGIPADTGQSKPKALGDQAAVRSA
jgi:hypothetical protein